jgi:hypothetical protein
MSNESEIKENLITINKHLMDLKTFTCIYFGASFSYCAYLQLKHEAKLTVFTNQDSSEHTIHLKVSEERVPHIQV